MAVRSLGMIADPATLPLVAGRAARRRRWVRLRAGLALTRFGAAGRNVLLAGEVGAHEPSRDMARLPSWPLPSGAGGYAA